MQTVPPRAAARPFASVLVGLVTFAFMLLWWNNWLGLTTDGWFFFYAHQLLLGKLPYRDFSLVIPPLHVLEVASLLRLFGEHLLIVHLFGVLQRVALAVIVFRWLGRTYDQTTAAIASLTMVVAASGDVADTVFFYHHDAAFWGVVAGFAASTVLERAQGSPRSAVRATLASGAAGGICFLIKQTAGMAVSITVAVLLFAILRRRLPHAAGRLLRLYALGWAVPVGLLMLWITAKGLLGSFMDSVFGRGAASKGALTQVLLRPVLDTLGTPYLARSAVAGAVLLGGGLLIRRLLRREANDLSGMRVPLVALVGLLAVLWGSTTVELPLPPARLFRICLVYGALIFALGLLVWLAAAWLRRSLTAMEEQRWLLAGVSGALAYAFSLSWPAWELMLAPSLALLIAEALERAPNGFARRGWKTVILAGCFFVVVSTTRSKLETPFIWGEWLEPSVHTADRTLPYPALAGFRLSPSTAGFVDTLTRLLQSYSRPGEAVFVFPHMPLLYQLADRPPATRSYAHWFDMTPDHIARADAETIRRDHPAVIVNYAISKGEWHVNEAKFRGGAASGQRALADAIAELGASADYVKVADFPAPETGNRVTVWARVRKPGEASPETEATPP